MTVWVALLRGINVGGANILPMKDLRDLLAGLGCRDVRTHAQSGNCVFRSADGDAEAIADRLGRAIEGRFGFHPRVFMLTAEALDAAVANNPYPQGQDEPASVHLFFLSAPAPAAGLAALDALKTGREAFALVDRVLYLYAPDGIGRSKLAAGVETRLGAPVTARNLRSVLKTMALARAI